MPAAKVSSQQMASRRAALEAQPTTKWINVVETTHGVPRQKRILVRNNIRDVDHLMMTMTNRLQPEKGAIRNLYTPAGGTQVTSLDQLNPDGSYVAGAGTQKFRQISNVIRQTSREKKNSVSSDESSSRNNTKGKRISLIERQNMIAQKAKEAYSTGNSNVASNSNSQTNIRPNNNLAVPGKGLPRRKFKVNVAKRRPLYPGKPAEKSSEPSSPVQRKNIRRPRKVVKRVPSEPVRSNVSSKRSTAKESRRGSTRSFTVLGSAHSRSSNKSGRSNKTRGSRSRSPTGSPERSRTPSPGTATPSRSPSPVSVKSGSRSPSRHGSPVSDRRSIRSRVTRSGSHGSYHSARNSMRSRNASGRSSRHSSRPNSHERSPRNSRSPSRQSRTSERNSNYPSRSPSRGRSLNGSQERSRSPSPTRSRSPSQDRSRSPSRGRSRSQTPDRSRSASPVKSRSPSQDRSRTPSQERSRTPSPITSRTPSAKSVRSSTPKGSIRSERSHMTRKSSRRNSLLTIQSRRSRRSSNGYETRQNSGGTQRSRSRNSYRSQRSQSGGSRRSSRRSSIRSRRTTTQSQRSDRSISRKRTEDVMDESDVEDDDRAPSHHGSLRYGSNFSSRSIRMNTRGSGHGELNNAIPSPLESRTASSRFKDYDTPFKASENSSKLSGLSRRTVEVDYDTDESGLYRAKRESAYSKNAPVIMDSSTTKINTPIELMEAKVIDDEEFYATSKSLKTLHL